MSSTTLRLSNLCLFYELHLYENFEINNCFIILNDNHIMLSYGDKDVFLNKKKYLNKIHNTYNKLLNNESFSTNT